MKASRSRTRSRRRFITRGTPRIHVPIIIMWRPFLSPWRWSSLPPGRIKGLPTSTCQNMIVHVNVNDLAYTQVHTEEVGAVFIPSQSTSLRPHARPWRTSSTSPSALGTNQLLKAAWRMRPTPCVLHVFAQQLRGRHFTRNKCSNEKSGPKRRGPIINS